jgi:hypothetical protein
MPVTETHCIDWKCGRCGEGARLPQLHMSTLDHIRHAIERGHERRAFECHLKHGIKHVSAIQDGKTLRFGATPSSSAPASTTTTAEELR